MLLDDLHKIKGRIGRYQLRKKITGRQDNERKFIMILSITLRLQVQGKTQKFIRYMYNNAEKLSKLQIPTPEFNTSSSVHFNNNEIMY